MAATKPPTPETTPPPQIKAADKPKTSVGKHRTTKRPATKSPTAKTGSHPKLRGSNKLKKPNGNCRVTKSITKSSTKPITKLTPKLSPKLTPEAGADGDTNTTSSGEAAPAANQMVDKEDCEESIEEGTSESVEDEDMDKEDCFDSCRANDINVPAASTAPAEDTVELSDSDLTDLDIEDIYEPTAITSSTTKTNSKSSKNGRGAASPSVVVSQAQAPKRKFAHLFEMRRKKPAPAARPPTPQKQPAFQSSTISLPSGGKVTLHPTRFEYPAEQEGAFVRKNTYISRPEKVMPNWLKDRPHLRPELPDKYFVAPAPKRVIPTGPVVPVNFKKSSKPNQFGKVPKFNLWQVVQGKKGTAAQNKLAGMSLWKTGEW